MTTEGATVREEVRRGTKRGKPSRASRDLLNRYHVEMRTELDWVLRLLRGSIGNSTIAERTKYWDLAIKLAKELGSEIDVAPPAEEPTPLRPNAAAADFG